MYFSLVMFSTFLSSSPSRKLKKKYSTENPHLKKTSNTFFYLFNPTLLIWPTFSLSLNNTITLRLAPPPIDTLLSCILLQHIKPTRSPPSISLPCFRSKTPKPSYFLFLSLHLSHLILASLSSYPSRFLGLEQTAVTPPFPGFLFSFWLPLSLASKGGEKAENFRERKWEKKWCIIRGIITNIWGRGKEMKSRKVGRFVVQMGATTRGVLGQSFYLSSFSLFSLALSSGLLSFLAFPPPFPSYVSKTAIFLSWVCLCFSVFPFFVAFFFGGNIQLVGFFWNLYDFFLDQIH